jgi:arsenate reductase (glutaredoxin)
VRLAESDRGRDNISLSHSRCANLKDQITVYEKPTCTKCREANKLLQEAGIEFDKVNYYVEPLSEDKLQTLLKKLNMSPRDLLRTSEPIYKELGLAHTQLDDSELVKLMVKHPDLIQRPIVERGERAVLGRPTENIKAILS